MVDPGPLGFILAVGFVTFVIVADRIEHFVKKKQERKRKQDCGCGNCQCNDKNK